MTSSKHLKQRVRARMGKTGESYQSARRSIENTSEDGQAPDAKIGVVIAKRFGLVREEAREPGSHAVTYRAKHVLLDGHFSIKLIPGPLGREKPHLRAWLLREGRVLQRIWHPLVRKVFDIGETEAGELYLVLETVPETSLRTVEPPFDDEFVLHVGVEVARVLEHAHASGVLYCGLSDGGISVDGAVVNGAVKVTELLYPLIDGDPRLAPEGAVYGHPDWLAPEQKRGEDGNAACDLYALGLILSKLLTRSTPGEHREALDSISRKLQSESPAARHASATELLAALRQLRGP
jgi:serine/threonine protein kinase